MLSLLTSFVVRLFPIHVSRFVREDRAHDRLEQPSGELPQGRALDALLNGPVRFLFVRGELSFKTEVAVQLPDRLDGRWTHHAVVLLQQPLLVHARLLKGLDHQPGALAGADVRPAALRALVGAKATGEVLVRLYVLPHLCAHKLELLEGSGIRHHVDDHADGDGQIHAVHRNAVLRDASPSVLREATEVLRTGAALAREVKQHAQVSLIAHVNEQLLKPREVGLVPEVALQHAKHERLEQGRIVDRVLRDVGALVPAGLVPPHVCPDHDVVRDEEGRLQHLHAPPQNDRLTPVFVAERPKAPRLLKLLQTLEHHDPAVQLASRDIIPQQILHIPVDIHRQSKERLELLRHRVKEHLEHLLEGVSPRLGQRPGIPPHHRPLLRRRRHRPRAHGRVRQQVQRGEQYERDGRLQGVIDVQNVVGQLRQYGVAAEQAEAQRDGRHAQQAPKRRPKPRAEAQSQDAHQRDAQHKWRQKALKPANGSQPFLPRPFGSVRRRQRRGFRDCVHDLHDLLDRGRLGQAWLFHVRVALADGTGASPRPNP
eukprot:scaffold1220_cov259-Pinguiococcus_pyrenoidosus.AAC.17